MKLMEQNNFIDATNEGAKEPLSEFERDSLAKHYQVSDDAKQYITKQNGQIFFKDLPIEKWYEVTSSRVGDAFIN